VFEVVLKEEKKCMKKLRERKKDGKRECCLYEGIKKGN
jgi:hypothetical protein